jgi:hypothetical protein
VLQKIPGVSITYIERQSGRLKIKQKETDMETAYIVVNRVYGKGYVIHLLTADKAIHLEYRRSEQMALIMANRYAKNFNVARGVDFCESAR